MVVAGAAVDDVLLAVAGRMTSSPSSPRTVSPSVSFGPSTSARASAHRRSLPGPPDVVSRPRLAKIVSSPGPPLCVSSPTPPDMKSLPPWPLEMSFPGPPCSRSAPSPPLSVSLPGPPKRRSGETRVAGVGTSPCSVSSPRLPQMRSAPCETLDGVVAGVAEPPVVPLAAVDLSSPRKPRTTSFPPAVDLVREARPRSGRCRASRTIVAATRP